jgi:hypothetical protein
MVFGFPEQRLRDLLGNDAASEDPCEGIAHHPLETALEAIDTAHSISLSSPLGVLPAPTIVSVVGRG